jgi:hypothetical protein
MPRKRNDPKLWFDKSRGTWTIIDGDKRVRTGCVERDLAVIAIHQYSNGTYNPVKMPTNVSLKPSAKRGVYVAGFDRYVKIGITTDLYSRMVQLQTPEPMTVYALLKGWLTEERSLHARFASLRLQGEWFQKAGELDAWIAAGCPMSVANDNTNCESSAA